MPAKAPSAGPVPASYFKLVRQFPLVKIRDDTHCDQASAMIDRLLRMDLDEGGEAYLDVLADLVGDYEDATVVFREPTEGGLLRSLMESNRLSQARLAKEVGIAQSTISAVLNGSRKLTKGHMEKIGRRFNLPASAFLPV
jgi:antitoxin component HigA of HigAB toxin-antitoxin module